MTIEEIRKCKLENVKDLVRFAWNNNIDLDYKIYDLEDNWDKKEIAAIISGLIDELGINAAYNFIKDVAEGDYRFVMEEDCEGLCPFTEHNFEELKDYILDQIS